MERRSLRPPSLRFWATISIKLVYWMAMYVCNIQQLEEYHGMKFSEHDMSCGMSIKQIENKWDQHVKKRFIFESNKSFLRILLVLLVLLVLGSADSPGPSRPSSSSISHTQNSHEKPCLAVQDLFIRFAWIVDFLILVWTGMHGSRRVWDMFSLFDPFIYVVLILPLGNFSLAHEKSFKMTFIQVPPQPPSGSACWNRSWRAGITIDINLWYIWRVVTSCS